MKIRYNIISKDIISLNSLNAIYVYTIINKYTDNKTKASFISQRRISELSGISIREIIRITNSFKKLANELFDSIDSIRKGSYTNNYYRFKRELKNYFYVNPEFFSTPLKGVDDNMQTKCKAFLLALKAICINNCNTCKFNKATIAKKLGLSLPTVTKMLNILISAGHILKRDNEFIINNEYIAMDYIDSTEETRKFLQLHKACIKYNVKAIERNSLAFMYAMENMDRLLGKKLNKDLTLAYCRRVITGKSLNYKRKIELPKYIME